MSELVPPDDGLLLVDELVLELELLEVSLLDVLGEVLIVELLDGLVVVLVDGLVVELVDELVEELVDGVVDELVDEGVAFGSVCEVVAAPLPGEAAVLLLFAVDCECETPTAAVRAAANATELQVRDLFIE
jgi:hypothetical protein